MTSYFLSFPNIYILAFKNYLSSFKMKSRRKRILLYGLCMRLIFLYLFFFFFFSLLAMLHSMWDLSSLTRDQIHTSYIGSKES